MNVTSDMNEHGALLLKIAIPAADLARVTENIRLELEEGIGEAFERWTGRLLWQAPTPEDAEDEDESDEEDEDAEPEKDSIEVGDWVKIWMDNKMTARGQLVMYSLEEIVIRAENGLLTDVWPGKITCVDQVDPPS